MGIIILYIIREVYIHFTPLRGDQPLQVIYQNKEFSVTGDKP